ncbi:uncharacterized protein B0H18DRAFT_1011704 [Fomitopsis serialis]|uniref:uncharacterized protein n=1 Tax=Fomitopsis serialis TaxID=139415 RepID=UPI0020080F09|nr:uncharacterized protein B0H18DRAFT_1011704 [Neoantrodia serialis]KAH9924557.1 hypothetical protein B0H18DRAFT_1011704 [Neoantrodia serialis]
MSGLTTPGSSTVPIITRIPMSPCTSSSTCARLFAVYLAMERANDVWIASSCVREGGLHTVRWTALLSYAPGRQTPSSAAA